MGEFLHGDILAAKRKMLTYRTGGRKHREFAHRTIPLFETKPHFFADGTRRTYNRHVRRIHIGKPAESRPGGYFSRFPQAGNRIVGALLQILGSGFGVDEARGLRHAGHLQFRAIPSDIFLQAQGENTGEANFG